MMSPPRAIFTAQYCYRQIKLFVASATILQSKLTLIILLLEAYNKRSNVFVKSNFLCKHYLVF